MSFGKPGLSAIRALLHYRNFIYTRARRRFQIAVAIRASKLYKSIAPRAAQRLLFFIYEEKARNDGATARYAEWRDLAMRSRLHLFGLVAPTPLNVQLDFNKTRSPEV